MILREKELFLVEFYSFIYYKGTGFRAGNDISVREEAEGKKRIMREESEIRQVDTYGELELQSACYHYRAINSGLV